MGVEDRKERERQARRAEILTAAEALFSERGFHEVTMEAIAERAELSKGAVYLYFASKEELFFTLMRDRALSFLATLEAAMQEPGSFIDRLTCMVRHYFAFFEKHRPFIRLIHAEKSRMDAQVADEFRREITDLFRRFVVFWERVMEMGKKEGVLRDVPAIHLVHCLAGMLDSFVFHCVTVGAEPSLVAQSEAAVDLFLHGGGK